MHTIGRNRVFFTRQANSHRAIFPRADLDHLTEKLYGRSATRTLPRKLAWVQAGVEPSPSKQL